MSLGDVLKKKWGVKVEHFTERTPEQEEAMKAYAKEIQEMEVTDTGSLHQAELRVVRQLAPASRIRQVLAAKCIELCQNEDKEFKFDQQSKRLINLLSLYFAKDERFLDGSPGRSLNKGLYLVGKCGVGKTMILKAAQLIRIPQGQFGMVSCNEVVMKYNQGGAAEIAKYCKRQWCFDDLGTENMGNHYGKEDVFTTLISERANLYVNKQLRTFITSNLTPEDLSTRYGDRIVSRVHQMFNIIAVGGEDRRLEK